MNTIALTVTGTLCVLILLLPRRYAALPLIIGACYLTLGQQMVVLSLNFPAIRIIIFLGWVRILLRRELFSFSLLPIDKLVLCWVAVIIATGILLTKNMDGFVNRAGFSYNALGVYFFFRSIIRDMEDVNHTIWLLGIIVVPLAALMTFEEFSGRNLFSFFGGVPEFSQIRAGRLRCQGPFRHPILAGTFGATLMPLLVWQWVRNEGSRLLTVIGLISVTIITVTPSSSGPALAYLFGIVGFLFWPLRDHMKVVRRCAVAALILLHFLMEAPVWFIISKIAHIIGGTGWHRSMIIDRAIRHFSEWWLTGTTNTAHWFIINLQGRGQEHVDITNNYILEGVNGGVLRLTLFIWIIVLAFKEIGGRIHSFKEPDFDFQFMLWSLGVSLFAHMVSFISVAYFDQIIVFWYLLWAMIAAVGKSAVLETDEFDEAEASEIQLIHKHQG